MRRLATRRSLVLAGLLLASLAHPGAAAQAADLAAHTADYTLKLASTRNNSDVTAATGTMSYEVIDACDGWAVRQRLSMVLTNRDGQDITMVSDYTTYETKDGLKLRFKMKQTTETAVTGEVAGDATLERTGGPGTVNYTLPEATTKPLPEGTLFPNAHTEAILAAAKAGKKFLTLPLFDGTGPSGAQDSTVVINNWDKPVATKWAPLETLPSGRVHIAFFDREAGQQQPEYEVSMRYWDNGVADELAMDFGDFVMAGTLAKLAVTKPGC